MTLDQVGAEMSESEVKNVESVDFSSLIMGFASAALYYLGEAQLPGKKPTETNYPLAKQNIDIVDMLKQKTTGNLTADEKALVDQVLLDLRARYVSGHKQA